MTVFQPGIKATLAVCTAVGFSFSVSAAPWIDPGDLRMRHSLQQLSDHRVMQTPQTTWPVMWIDAQGFSPSQVPGHNESVAQSFAYIRFEANQQARLGFRAKVELNGASDPLLFRSFASLPREKGEIGKHIEWTGEWATIGISPSYAFDAQDDKEYRLDGSYAAITLGNWVFGAGAIERWWGPGWHTSLILSSNARPVPGFWFNRKQALAPESRWLSWIGPWTFTAFGGQLENSRHIPEAKLLGARFAFMPISRLEIGLSRTAQWGGEGRPESLSNLFDLMLGTEDNVYTEEGRKDEPGNQLGGIDFRYGFPLGQASLGIYAQTVGEDEAGGFPSKRFNLLGLDMATQLASSEQRLYLEYADTVVGSLFEGRLYNVAYEHGLYRTGYRYRGRNLAATWDSDARVLTLGAINFFSSGSDLALALSRAELNQDGRSRAAVPDEHAKHYLIPSTSQDLWILDLAYRFVFLNGRTTLWGQWMNDKLQTVGGEMSEFAVGASWQYRF